MSSTLRILSIFVFPSIFLILPISTQYYNPGLYSGIGRQQTVLVPVYSQGMMYPYGGGYGGGYGGYPGYGGGGMMMMNPCCGGMSGGAQYGGAGMMMPNRESNAKKFLRGATEGVFMGSIGMLGFRR